jgi:hypothetical protein
MAVVSVGSDNPAITQLELSRSPFYIFTSEHCHLASEFELKFNQLGGLRLALFERISNPRIFGTIIEAAGSRGGARLKFTTCRPRKKPRRLSTTKAGCSPQLITARPETPLSHGDAWELHACWCRKDARSRILNIE